MPPVSVVVDYDLEAVGWRTDVVSEDGDVDRKWSFDTAEPGYSNAGHTLADGLEPEERRAVLEYLKTL